MLLEGYQFAGGQITRLTLPQMLFLGHTFEFRMQMKGGKKKGSSAGRRKSAGLVGTPEQINAVMAPKFEKMDKEGRAWEIENAPRRSCRTGNASSERSKPRKPA